MTRDEVARLLWACWRHGRTVRLPRGREKGQVIESEWHDLRHIARFILMGVYTGSRSGAIFSASIYAGANRSLIDLESGLFYRLAEGAVATNKRQPPVRLPKRLLAHIRRWRDRWIIAQHVVEWDGLPVKSIKVGWKRAVALSGIDKKITPHTLRHTAATWLMQQGVDKWETAGFLGMSEAMVERSMGTTTPLFRPWRRIGLPASGRANDCRNDCREPASGPYRVTNPLKKLVVDAVTCEPVSGHASLL